MTPATLAEIGALGHEEKQAAREYQSLPLSQQDGVEYGETWQAYAFLQGILWERKRRALGTFAGAATQALQEEGK